MFRFSVFHRFHKKGSIILLDHSGSLLAVIAIPLLLGIVFGSIIGSFLDLAIPSSVSHVIPFLPAIYPTPDSSFYHTQSLFLFLLTSVCSTGFLGVIFLPALSFARGFLFSSATAALIVSNQSGCFSSLLYICIPSLLSLPVFLLTACNGWRFSKRILPWNLGKFSEYDAPSFEIKSFLLIVTLLAAEAAYFQVLLPIFIR